MINKRNVRTGPQRPVRILSSFGRGIAAIAIAAAASAYPATAHARAAAPLLVAGAEGVSEFYKARSNRPLWFSQTGRQAQVLIETLKSADLDGLDSGARTGVVVVGFDNGWL